MSTKRKTVFVDTNDFLHFLFFTEIDWPTLIGADEIKIVIAPVVMRELEKHKYNYRDDVIRRRAQKVSARLAQLFRSHEEVRPRTRIEFEHREPDDELGVLGLSRESQDDQLLASVHYYMKEHPGEKVILVTNDLPLFVKALPLSVDTLELPEVHRLPSEVDPRQKKIRELEQKVRELENRMPDPELAFDTGSNRLVVPTLSTESPIQSVLDRMAELKAKRPKLPELPLKADHNPLPKDGVDLRAVLIKASSYPEDQPHPSEIRSYNLALESFYDEYEKYLIKKDEIEEKKARTVQLKIQLQNSGTAPVERAVVFMKLPGDLRLVTSGHGFQVPKQPTPPDPPKPRKSLFDSLTALSRFDTSPLFLNSSILNRPLEPPNIEENELENRDGSHYVSFRVRQGIHGLIYKCPYDLFVVFDSVEQARSFQIEWRIVASNLPQAVEGSLHVILDRGGN